MSPASEMSRGAAVNGETVALKRLPAMAVSGMLSGPDPAKVKVIRS